MNEHHCCPKCECKFGTRKDLAYHLQIRKDNISFVRDNVDQVVKSGSGCFGKMGYWAKKREYPRICSDNRCLVMKECYRASRISMGLNPDLGPLTARYNVKWVKKK